MAYIVFVYGTLRRGEANHHYLSSSLCVSDKASAEGWLGDTGNGYPAMVVTGVNTVQGELYEVDERTLSLLDELEDYYGHGHSDNEYDRVEISVVTDRGSIKALTYVYATQKLAALLPIPSGDWKIYRQGTD